MKTYKVLREEIEKNVKKYEEYIDRFNQINEADQELLDVAAYGSGKYVKLQNKIVSYNNIIINIYTDISTHLNKVENLNQLDRLSESVEDVLKALEQKSEAVKSRMNGVRLFSLTYMNLERDLLNLSTSIKEYTDIAEDIKNIEEEAKRAKEEQDEEESQELLEEQKKALAKRDIEYGTTNPQQEEIEVVHEPVKEVAPKVAPKKKTTPATITNKKATKKKEE